MIPAVLFCVGVVVGWVAATVVGDGVRKLEHIERRRFEREMRAQHDRLLRNEEEEGL